MNPRLEASKLLGFPIGQTLEEINILSKYARLVDPSQVIIDVGTRNGGSAIILAMSSQSEVYTIDIKPDPREPGFGYGEIPPLREHWDSFPFGDRIYQITCTSWEYQHKGAPVGLVFLDGDHTYEGFGKDWANFWPILDSGGYMLCHDYNQFDGVTRFLDEISSTFNCVDLAGTTAVFRKGGE